MASTPSRGGHSGSRAALLTAACLLACARPASAQVPDAAASPAPAPSPSPSPTPPASPASQPAATATTTARSPEFWWIAPPECPDLAHVHARIEQILGQPLAAIRRRAFSARVAVSRARRGAGHYRAHLETITPDGGGERWLEDASCAHLAESTATIVALAIGADLPPPPPHHDTPPPPARPPPPTPPTRPTPARPTAAAPARLASPPEPFAHLGTWAVGGTVLLDARSLPAPTAGVRVYARRRVFGAARVELGLGVFAPQSRLVSPDDTSSAGVSAWLATASARACYALAHPAAIPVEVEPCIGLEAGAFVARSVVPSQWMPPGAVLGATLPWVAPTAAGRVLVRLGPVVALALEAEVFVALLRPILDLTPFPAPAATASSDVFRSAGAGARLGLGAEIRIP